MSDEYDNDTGLMPISAAIHSTAMGEITRAEIDSQISTAKRYPRSLARSVKQARDLATMSENIAAACIYSLPRGGKKLTGPSVRMAEIVASAWGNMRFGARVIGDDGKFLTVQGYAHDLESNTAFAFELKLKVTDKNGRRYSDDMIAMTSNAGSSKALRNAVFRVVPRAIVDEIITHVREVIRGDVKTLGARRVAAIEHIEGRGVELPRILNAIGRAGIEEITGEDLVSLRGMMTAINEGELTLSEAFPEPGVKPGAIGDAITRTEEVLRQTQETVKPASPGKVSRAQTKRITQLLEEAKVGEEEYVTICTELNMPADSSQANSEQAAKLIAHLEGRLATA